MKNWSGFLQFLLYGILTVGFVGCDSPNAQKHTYETLAFNVDESRLEPAVTDTVLRITLAVPKGWEKIEDSMLAQVVNELEPQLTAQALQMDPRWIFFNQGSRAMCVVSHLKSVESAPDETLLKTLSTAYQNQFPNATIRQTAFMKEPFRVHQLMVISADFVLIKLICDAPEALVFAVDYSVPKNVYATELRAIESSIGSINLIHK